MRTAFGLLIWILGSSTVLSPARGAEGDGPLCPLTQALPAIINEMEEGAVVTQRPSKRWIDHQQDVAVEYNDNLDEAGSNIHSGPPQRPRDSRRRMAMPLGKDGLPTQGVPVDQHYASSNRPKTPTAGKDRDSSKWIDSTRDGMQTTALRPDQVAPRRSREINPLRANVEAAMAPTVAATERLSEAQRAQTMQAIQEALLPLQKIAKETPSNLNAADHRLIRQAQARLRILADADIPGTIDGKPVPDLHAPRPRTPTLRGVAVADIQPSKAANKAKLEVRFKESETPFKPFTEGEMEQFPLAAKDRNAPGSIGIGHPGRTVEVQRGGKTVEVIVDATPPFEPTRGYTYKPERYTAPPPRDIPTAQIPDPSTTLEQWINLGRQPGESATVVAGGGEAVIVAYHPHLPDDLAAIARSHTGKGQDPRVIRWVKEHHSRAERVLWIRNPANKDLPHPDPAEWARVANRDYVGRHFAIQDAKHHRTPNGPVYEPIMPKNPDSVGTLRYEVDLIDGVAAPEIAHQVDLALHSPDAGVRFKANQWVKENTGLSADAMQHKVGDADVMYDHSQDAAGRYFEANGIKHVGSPGRGGTDGFLRFDPRDKGWGKQLIWDKEKGIWVKVDF